MNGRANGSQTQLSSLQCSNFTFQTIVLSRCTVCGLPSLDYTTVQAVTNATCLKFLKIYTFLVFECFRFQFLYSVHY